mgnify:CR=1 FL=1
MAKKKKQIVVEQNQPTQDTWQELIYFPTSVYMLEKPEFLESVRNLNADVFVVVAFRMMPQVLFSIPRLGTFNLHGSLLPDYRGAAPINFAVINGETKSGVTTFFIVGSSCKLN